MMVELLGFDENVESVFSRVKDEFLVSKFRVCSNDEFLKFVPIEMAEVVLDEFIFKLLVYNEI
jgi:hypothetical protein